MNKNVKKKWLKALESGKYLKGKGSLIQLPEDGVETTSYCCLGVLCELYKKEFPRSRAKWQDNAFGTEKNNRDDFLPNCVSKWAGLPVVGETVENNKVQGKLGEINDNTSNFNQVVTYIKDNL